MRDLLVGVTVPIALIVGALAVASVHAKGPETTEGGALVELVVASAPLAAPTAASPPSPAGPQVAGCDDQTRDVQG